MTCSCGANSMARHLMNIKKAGGSIADAHDYEGQDWKFRPIDTSDPDLEFRITDLKEYLP